MNKVYRIIWSKVKNCYVVTSELAKRKTKAPKRGLFRMFVAGVLAAVLSCGSLFPVAEAVTVTGSFQTPKRGSQHSSDDNANWTSQSAEGVFYGNSGFDSNYDKAYVTFTFDNASLQAAIAAVGSGGGTTYTAGNGITISGTTFSAKAGTNVTVNGNGISVTGNGTVASGNTGLISGGTAYTELRPSDNGNYEEYFSTLL